MSVLDAIRECNSSSAISVERASTAAVCPRGVLKLENGLPGDRYEDADSPVTALIESFQKLEIYRYEA